MSTVSTNQPATCKTAQSVSCVTVFGDAAAQIAQTVRVAPVVPTLDETYQLVVAASREACTFRLRFGSQMPLGASKKVALIGVPAESRKAHERNWGALLKCGRVHLVQKNREGAFYLPDFLLKNDDIDRVAVDAFVNPPAPVRYALIVPSFDLFFRITWPDAARKAVLFASEELALAGKQAFARDLNGAYVEPQVVTDEKVASWIAEGRCEETLFIDERTIGQYVEAGARA